MTSPLQRDLNYRLTANTGDFERGFGNAEKSARAFERELAREEARQAKVDVAMTQLGMTMLTAGAAIGIGLGLATKAAIDWETSWAGVLKTVDGTDEQMAALEEEIRGLTAVLPASHAEIAAVAEAAGQLGVQRDNVADFTKVMIDMGEATNLAATDAATALARLMNIMQTAPEDVSRLGSAIVDLGNTSATTEAEIVNMALRIAGAGNTIGLTESDVVGFAAALSSVGIRAEAGGTAISRVFLEIDTAVRQGGDTLQVFAETAGMTAEEFQRAYRRDAAGAINEFVVGLGRVQTSGGDVNAVLGELGLTEIRVSDALRRLSGSGDLLTRSLDRGATAWEDNSALIEEAERRYGTVEARMSIARNQVNDFAIDLGQTFLPVVGDMADRVGTVATLFRDLPGPVKTVLGVLGGVTAAMLLAGGTALIAVPKIAAFSAALDRVQNSSGRAATAVGVFRRATSGVAGILAGPWGVAIGAGITALTAYAVSQANARAKIDDLSKTLDEQTGAVTENTRMWVANELANRKATGAFTLNDRQTQDFVTNLERANVGMEVAVDAVLGEADAIEILNQRLEDAKQRHEDLSSGPFGWPDEAEKEAQREKRAIEDIIEVVEDENGKIKDATELQRLLAEGRGETTQQTQELSAEEQRLADQFAVTDEVAGELAEGIDELDKALKGLFDAMFGVEEAQDAAAQAMRRLTEEAEENGTKLDGNSKAALANRDNMRSLIRAHGDVIARMAEEGATADELTAATERLRKKFVDQATEAGFSEEAIEEYAEAYDLIPSEVRTNISTPGLTEAERRLRNLRHNIITFPGLPIRGGHVAMQHGGEVHGPAGIDRVPARLTAGEIVIRREVAQPNRAALLAFNETGRFPVAVTAGSSPAAGGRGAVATQVIENVNVTPITGEFRTKQIFDDLAMHGAS